MAQENPEYTVLVNCMMKLEKAFKDNRDIVHFLQHKSGMLVQKIRDKVDLNPRNFYILYKELICHEEIYKDIILILQLEMRKLGVIIPKGGNTDDMPISAISEATNASIYKRPVVHGNITNLSINNPAADKLDTQEKLLSPSSLCSSCKDYSDLQKKVKSLDEEFTEFVFSFVDYLEENNTTVSYLKRRIKLIPGYFIPIITPLWEKLRPKLETITEIDDFLQSLNLNLWNFLDYEMLEYLIRKCNATQLAEEMQNYVLKINQFKRMTLVIPFIQCWDGHKSDNIPESVVEVVIKIKKDISKITLSDLDDLRHSIRNNCVPLLAYFAAIMYYNTFSEGSVCVSWLFPKRFSLVLQFRVQKISKVLEKYNVVLVKVNEKTIYSQKCITKLYRSFSEQSICALSDDKCGKKRCVSEEKLSTHSKIGKDCIVQSVFPQVHSTDSKKVVSALHEKSVPSDEQFLTLDFSSDTLFSQEKSIQQICSIAGTLLEVNVAKFTNEMVNDNQEDTNYISNIHRAAVYGNLQEMQCYIVKSSCDIFTPNAKKQSVLHMAVIGGNAKIVQFLLQLQGVNSLLTDIYELMPLHYAVIIGQFEIFKLLINHMSTKTSLDGILTITTTNFEGTQANIFHVAIHMKQTEIVFFLLNCFSQHDALSDYLSLALSTIHDSIFELLVDALDFNSECKHIALCVAAARGQLGVVQSLLNIHHCNVLVKTNNNNSLFYCAAMKEQIKVMKFLCNNILPKDIESLCKIASERGYLKVIKYLHQNNYIFNITEEIVHTALHVSSKGGHLSVAKYLIEHCHCDPHSTDKMYNTPLHWAAYSGNLELVKYLTDNYHCDINTRGHCGRTPFHVACQKGHLNVAKHLIEHCHSDPHSTDENNNTPLHYAAYCGNLELVKYLTSNQHCEVNMGEHYGRMPLHVACIEGHLEVVKYLIEDCHCDPLSTDNNTDTPLHIASYFGNLELVKYLIDNYHCDVNMRGQYARTSLHEACIEGHLDLVKYLIEHGHSDPHSTDEDNNTPLHIAALSGNLELVEYFTDNHHCEAYTRGQYGSLPLHAACEIGHFDIAKYLIEHCHSDPCSTDEKNNTPMHSAAFSGNLKLVQYLTETHHCDVNTSGFYGRTPLHVACIELHLDITKYLIEHHHSDLNAIDDDSNTPLHLAAYLGNLELVKDLTDSSHCEVNIRGQYGRMPLHLACIEGHLNVAKHLIEHCHSDPHSMDENYDTPLHIAAVSGNLELVKYLTHSHYSDVNMTRHYGRGSLHVACEEGHLNVAKHLIEHCHSDPHSTDEYNSTPLHYAAHSGNLELVKYLTEIHHCDVNTRRRYGRIPLHVACIKGHLDVAKYLIEHCHSDPHCTDRDNNMPLNIAIINKHPLLVNYLTGRQVIEGKEDSLLCSTKENTKSEQKVDELYVRSDKKESHIYTPIKLLRTLYQGIQKYKIIGRNIRKLSSHRQHFAGSLDPDV